MGDDLCCGHELAVPTLASAGAFLGNLDQQLAEPPNPASQIAIVPGPGKGKPKASNARPQDKAK
jgi:hypothetical protein